MYAILERRKKNNKKIKQIKNSRQSQQNCWNYETGRYIKENRLETENKELLDKENKAGQNFPSYTSSTG